MLRPSASRRADLLLLAAGLALAVLILLPAIHAAFRGDDTWASELPGRNELRGGGSWLAASWDDAVNFVTDQGRPQPLVPYLGFGIHEFLGDARPLYLLLLTLMTVTVVGLTAALLRRLGVGTGGAVLACLLFVGLLQFRRYHDTSLGYTALVQIIFAFTLVSLLFLQHHLETGSRRSLVMAVVAFLPAPLLYEVAYPFVALHIGLVLCQRRGREAVPAAAPFVVLGAGFVLLSFVLRQVAPNVSTGYGLEGGGLWSAVRIYFVQLIPPLPTSTILFDPSIIDDQPTKAEYLGAAWRGLVAAAVGAVVLWRASRAEDRTERVVPAVLVLGAILWLAPPLLLSLAPKYQHELNTSRGYLPVLMQVMGMALLAATGLVAAARAAARRSTSARLLVVGAATAAVGFAVGVTWYANLRVVALERPVVLQRDLIEDALDDGLLDGIAPRTTLLVASRDFAWPTGQFIETEDGLDAFFRHDAGREVDARQTDTPLRPAGFTCPDDGGPFPPSDCSPIPVATAFLDARLHKDETGTVFVTTTRDTRPADPRTAAADRIWAWTSAGDGPPRLAAERPDGSIWTSEGLAWTRDGRIWTAPVDERPPPAEAVDDPDGFYDFTVILRPREAVRVFGASHVLP